MSKLLNGIRRILEASPSHGCFEANLDERESEDGLVVIIVPNSCILLEEHREVLAQSLEELAERLRDDLRDVEVVDEIGDVALPSTGGSDHGLN